MAVSGEGVENLSVALHNIDLHWYILQNKPKASSYNIIRRFINTCKNRLWRST